MGFSVVQLNTGARYIFIQNLAMLDLNTISPRSWILQNTLPDTDLFAIDAENQSIVSALGHSLDDLVHSSVEDPSSKG